MRNNAYACIPLIIAFYFRLGAIDPHSTLFSSPLQLHPHSQFSRKIHQHVHSYRSTFAWCFPRLLAKEQPEAVLGKNIGLCMLFVGTLNNNELMASFFSQDPINICFSNLLRHHYVHAQRRWLSLSCIRSLTWRDVSSRLPSCCWNTSPSTPAIRPFRSCSSQLDILFADSWSDARYRNAADAIPWRGCIVDSTAVLACCSLPTSESQWRSCYRNWRRTQNGWQNNGNKLTLHQRTCSAFLFWPKSYSAKGRARCWSTIERWRNCGETLPEQHKQMSNHHSIN